MCPYILDVQMQEHIENLPKRRRLNDAEEQELLQMLEMRGNKWLIHQHIIKSTGKMQFLIHFLPAQLVVSLLLQHGWVCTCFNALLVTARPQNRSLDSDGWLTILMAG